MRNGVTVTFRKALVKMVELESLSTLICCILRLGISANITKLIFAPRPPAQGSTSCTGRWENYESSSLSCARGAGRCHTNRYKVQVPARDVENAAAQRDGKTFDPFEERKNPNPTTDCDTLTHLLKASLRTGILAMPVAFKSDGLFVGIFATILVAFVCTHCAYIIVKEAISPSVAECLRAVFAAFLWHEGIVHDAMACASFLKFHPTLPKQGAMVVTRQSPSANDEQRRQEMTREERARQKYSVEVTNDGNYLHIQPSTLESLTRSAANANANRSRKKADVNGTDKTANKLTALPEFTTVTVPPPALKSLVFLWEELSLNVLQAIDQQTVLPSPITAIPGGNGYNSGGNYCVGWAGNCGDGGGGGSSWYLLCDTCRDKYLKAKKNKRHRRSTSDINKHMSPLTSPDVDETHIIVKNNAVFLLELASAAGVNIPKQQSRPSQTLTSVAENYSPPEAAGPFPSTGPFQSLLSLAVQHSQSNDERLYEESLRRQEQNSYEGSSNELTALNWLLRTVTQPICLHDLLWWFANSLTPIVADSMDINEDDNRKRVLERRKDHDTVGMCEHPLNDLIIAGEAAHPLSTAFHTLLQIISDLVLLLPPGSPLQQAAVRCWAIQFTPADHMFLHRSHVFSNISKILSRSEEEEDATVSMHKSHQSNLSGQQYLSTVETLRDLTPGVEVKTSSRQAMISSLMDNSTETFWESGDEDRDKTKTITIICGAHNFPKMLYIHIDNCRDLTHKVSSVTFQSGVDADEMAKLKTVEIESRSTGWVNCSIIHPRHAVIGLELKGPDNSLRVRQIRVLGEIDGESVKIGKPLSAASIQQKNCEAETLKVFRSITSQVFGKFIQGEHQNPGPISSLVIEPNHDELEESNELREHMVGILFSRSKLTHLQKQVCTHIVQAIRKETVRLREEWETLMCSPTPVNSVTSDNSDLPKAADTYCFEMLSMVLALSGSSVGRTYLSHQSPLLKDILSLLHTGSARVQRQVTSLLRRILPEIKPDVLANVVGAERLPPSDFSIISAASNAYSHSIEFDEHNVGILDVFLSCIAKSLTVQVEVKDKENNGKALQSISLATSIHPKSYVGARWWLRGCISRKLAEEIIQLLKDMASGKVSDAWAAITKAAIAENILNLTRVDDKNRDPTKCLRSPTLWLALSSLCVLDGDHVERLSSGQWSSADGQPPPPRPMCSNHDDGETTAIIQCDVC